MDHQISKTEKTVILIILIALTIAWILMFFKEVDPDPITKPSNTELLDSKKFLEEENKELKELLDSIKTADSIRLIELNKSKTSLNIKKDEIRKTIKFLPDSDSKFRDSLWTVYLKD